MFVAGCGARSELWSPVTCEEEGAVRGCADLCGQGRQTCHNERWSSCLVPTATRACSDGCGTGQQTCTANVWSACTVPVAIRGCSDDCGSGQQECRDGGWQACVVPEVQRDCSSVCGSGHETCRKGSWGRCDAPQPKPPQLAVTIRDFSPTTHPDFEASYPSGLDKGIVLAALGPDEKPVYAGMPKTKSTSGAANFDKWYHNDPVNRSATLDLQLVPSPDDPGFFQYDSQAFFPIDGELLGNEGRNHNFHFTLEAKSTFEYHGGEVFSFTGDDDMWVFINRLLAIDLGGLHPKLSAHVSLDEIAPAFGLQRGSSYSLHFFFAERHTLESHFTLHTSISDPGSCD